MSDDLGFTYKKHQDSYHIYHHGSKACVLRGLQASKFEEAIISSDTPEQQKLMARLTGNYKRGNERSARQHQRNRN